MSIKGPEARQWLLRKLKCRQPSRQGSPSRQAYIACQYSTHLFWSPQQDVTQDHSHRGWGKLKTSVSDPDPNPDQPDPHISGSRSTESEISLRGMDPRIRIRIHTKMSWIRITAENSEKVQVTYLQSQSRQSELARPRPLTRKLVLPPLWFQGGHTLMRKRGRGDPIRTKGRHSDTLGIVYSLYTCNPPMAKINWSYGLWSVDSMK